MYLKSDDIVLRDATTDDIEILCQWWSDGKIMAHAGFPNGVHTDRIKLEEKIKNNCESDRRLIIEIASKRVGEMNFTTKDKVSEIGIKICDFTYQERGYGTRVLRMLINYLFSEINVDKIVLDTNLKNTRAQHVYEKLGFKKTGVRIDSWRDQLGTLQSAVDYELNKEDFHSASDLI
jgi:RimJ/RimL family protein N-acetyltransferase